MKTPVTTGEVLLERVLGLHPEKDDFVALQRNADLVLSFLDQPEAEALFRKHADQLTPERLADVYSALGSDEDIDEAEAQHLQAFLRASEEDEKCVGTAFAEALLPSLPLDMTRFSDRVFLGSDVIKGEAYDFLLQEISVQTGGASARELARYGITPVSLLAASQGVANLARRFCEANDIQLGGHLVLDKADVRHETSFLVLPRETAVNEVMLISELDENKAGRLFDWLTQAAGWISQIFSGFEAALWGDELRLTRTDIVRDDLFVRWSSPMPKRLTV